MSNENATASVTVTYSQRQVNFLKYTFMILIDLVVLGLFNQYWDWVHIDTFTVALLAAALLQFLMQVAIKVEHKVAQWLFEGKSGTHIKVMRGVSAWAVIFVSKLVILEAVSFVFGESVTFLGPLDGLVSFLTVVIGIIAAEQGMAWIYRSLASKDLKSFNIEESFRDEE